MKSTRRRLPCLYSCTCACALLSKNDSALPFVRDVGENDAVRFSISRHAANRYRERCSKEHLTLEQAKAELSALVAGARLEQRPEWASEQAGAQKAAGYIVLADSIALPVARGGVVLTVLTRGSGQAEWIRKRREGRRKRRAYLRHKAGSHAGPQYEKRRRMRPEAA